jgi:hypothetical protein
LASEQAFESFNSKNCFYYALDVVKGVVMPLKAGFIAHFLQKKTNVKKKGI